MKVYSPFYAQIALHLITWTDDADNQPFVVASSQIKAFK